MHSKNLPGHADHPLLLISLSMNVYSCRRAGNSEKANEYKMWHIDITNKVIRTAYRHNSRTINIMHLLYIGYYAIIMVIVFNDPEISGLDYLGSFRQSQ
jgi:hypothetical protein